MSPSLSKLAAFGATHGHSLRSACKATRSEDSFFLASTSESTEADQKDLTNYLSEAEPLGYCFYCQIGIEPVESLYMVLIGQVTGN